MVLSQDGYTGLECKSAAIGQFVAAPNAELNAVVGGQPAAELRHSPRHEVGRHQEIGRSKGCDVPADGHQLGRQSRHVGENAVARLVLHVHRELRLHRRLVETRKRLSSVYRLEFGRGEGGVPS